MLKRAYLWLPLLAYIGFAQADNAAITRQLEKIMPTATIEGIQPLTTTGLFEAIINGEIVYFSADGKYVFQGDVIDLTSRENITENKRISLRKSTLASLDEKELIVYSPKKVKHTLTIFTDIDCGYCRKLHNEMAEYNDLGIEIRYMAFPRAGLNSESFDKAEAVWCSDDPKQAMTDAKNGFDINDSKSCKSPIEAQYKLGRRLGVSGTPAIFLESGEMLPGYIPPKKLIAILDEEA